MCVCVEHGNSISIWRHISTCPRFSDFLFYLLSTSLFLSRNYVEGTRSKGNEIILWTSLLFWNIFLFHLQHEKKKKKEILSTAQKSRSHISVLIFCIRLKCLLYFDPNEHIQQRICRVNYYLIISASYTDYKIKFDSGSTSFLHWTATSNFFATNAKFNIHMVHRRKQGTQVKMNDFMLNYSQAQMMVIHKHVSLHYCVIERNK